MMINYPYLAGQNKPIFSGSTIKQQAKTTLDKENIHPVSWFSNLASSRAMGPFTGCLAFVCHLYYSHHRSFN